MMVHVFVGYDNNAEIISDLCLPRDKLSRLATKGAPLPGNLRPGSAAASKGLSREERRRKLVRQNDMMKMYL